MIMIRSPAEQLTNDSLGRPSKDFDQTVTPSFKVDEEEDGQQAGSVNHQRLCCAAATFCKIIVL